MQIYRRWLVLDSPAAAISYLISAPDLKGAIRHWSEEFRNITKKDINARHVRYVQIQYLSTNPYHIIGLAVQVNGQNKEQLASLQNFLGYPITTHSIVLSSSSQKIIRSLVTPWNITDHDDFDDFTK